MPTILDERRVRELAQEHLKPNACEWWLLQQCGDESRGIPPDLSCRRLAARIGVHYRTLSRSLLFSRNIMQPILTAERQKPTATLFFIRETPPDQVSYQKTLAEGHSTRTVTDKTQKRALKRVVGR